MTNSNLVWLCVHEAIPYRQISSGDLLALAQSTAGKQAFCMGFLNGQALPGNEQNVFGHCITVLDWDGTHFTIANGDSTNGGQGKTDLVTSAEILAAQPQQITILELTMVPSGWTDDGTTLKAPDGTPVVFGFRTYILGNAWRADDVPYSAEHPSNPLEYGDGRDHNEGQSQEFRYSRLIWDKPSNTVLLSWVGFEYAQTRALYEAELAKPQAQAGISINGAAPVPVSKVTVTYE